MTPVARFLRRSGVIAFLIFLTSQAMCERIAAEYSLTLTAENLGVHNEAFFEENRGALSVNEGAFAFNFDLSMMGGRRYPAHTSYQLGRYFRPNDFSIHAALGNAGLYAGYLPHSDVVNTPYSLYISALEIPVLNGGFRFDSERFFYLTRWVRLNQRSSVEYIGKDMTYRDRGLTFKTFGFDFGALRLGFQDSYLYLDQSFDAESFLAPIPMFLLQMALASGGRPWSQANNINSMFGFFAEWESGPYYLESQILVDDINASLLAPLFGWAIPALNHIENLSKVAWNIGGTMELGPGTIGFYHGGATKYTFAATYTSSDNFSLYPYEYVYYPATEYRMPSGELRTLRYQDNYIGYKHGENNIAFTVEYSAPMFVRTAYHFDLTTSAEWIINGSKSPANPWHEYQNWLEIEPRFELLSDDVVEHIVKLDARASKEFPPFELSLALLLGYGWNQLELAELVPGEPKIFTPQPGNNGFLFSLSLTGTYKVEL